jgi:hypothetical protein
LGRSLCPDYSSPILLRRQCTSRGMQRGSTALRPGPLTGRCNCLYWRSLQEGQLEEGRPLPLKSTSRLSMTLIVWIYPRPETRGHSLITAQRQRPG